jgi:hypothetical protein
MQARDLSEDEARRRVAIEMGGIDQVREDVRETWTWRWVDDAMRDARYAARSLLRSRAFTSTAALSLAIGIGASAALFSLLDQALFRLLPVKEPERLVLIDWKGKSLSDNRGSFRARIPWSCSRTRTGSRRSAGHRTSSAEACSSTTSR